MEVQAINFVSSREPMMEFDRRNKVTLKEKYINRFYESPAFKKGKVTRSEFKEFLDKLGI